MVVTILFFVHIESGIQAQVGFWHHAHDVDLGFIKALNTISCPPDCNASLYILLICVLVPMDMVLALYFACWHAF